jgi:hypothetical protein
MYHQYDGFGIDGGKNLFKFACFYKFKRLFVEEDCNPYGLCCLVYL